MSVETFASFVVDDFEFHANFAVTSDGAVLWNL
jgi:hypothetical protein